MADSSHLSRSAIGVNSPDAYRTLTTGYAGSDSSFSLSGGSGAGAGSSNSGGGGGVSSSVGVSGSGGNSSMIGGSGGMVTSGSASGSATADETMTTVHGAPIVTIDADLAVAGKVDDTLVCSICTNVMRDPHLVVNCGHHFCLQCLEKYRTTRSECALCRGQITGAKGEVVPDLSLGRRINDIKIRCESSDLGCQWIGLVGDYAAHCRSDDCQVTCPQKCGENLQRTKVDEHIAEVCPRSLVPCKFVRIGAGCKSKLLRCELAEHLRHSMLEHQILLAQSVDSLTSHVWMAASTPNHERTTVFTWVFTDFKRYLDGSKNRLFSEPFYIGPCDSGYRLVLRVETGYQDQAISTFYCVARGKNDDRLEWPFRRPVTFQALHSVTHKVVIQDRSMPPTREESIRLITARPKTERNRRGWGRATFVPFKRLDEIGLNAANSFVLRIVVPWSGMSEATK
eukprot:scpid49852/ scgid21051/ TNF receptor-associated factor 4; Cysteine-rich motif associated to RING and Traf domains protein 1